MSIIYSLLICGMIIVGNPLSVTGHYGTACVQQPGKRTQAGPAGGQAGEKTKIVEDRVTRSMYIALRRSHIPSTK